MAGGEFPRVLCIIWRYPVLRSQSCELAVALNRICREHNRPPEGETSMSTPVHPRRRRYGWTPDLPDARDHLFSLRRSRLAVAAAQRRPGSTCPPVSTRTDRTVTASATPIGAAFRVRYHQAWACPISHALTPVHLLQRAGHGGIYRDRLRRAYRDGVKSVAISRKKKRKKLGVWPRPEWALRNDGRAPQRRRNVTGRGPAGREVRGHSATRTRSNHARTTYSRVLRDLDQMKACLAAG